MVVKTYKNFTTSWQWAGHEKIEEKVTLSTSNVSLYWPEEEEMFHIQWDPCMLALPLYHRIRASIQQAS